MSEAPDPSPAVVPLKPVGTVHVLVHAVRTRVMGGLILALPIVLTFWIVYWLYSSVKQIFLDPAIAAVRYLVFGKNALEVPAWFNYVSAAIAILSVLLILYLLGLFVSLRLQSAVDWVMFRLPFITTIYKALRNVFNSLDVQLRGGGAQRVVLVEFPHPGTRALGFVTNSLREPSGGRTILSVYVMTGLVPPAGFTLFVPEDAVIETHWSANQALQAILSGGMTTPAIIPFDRGQTSSRPKSIVDPMGRQIVPEPPLETVAGPGLPSDGV